MSSFCPAARPRAPAISTCARSRPSSGRPASWSTASRSSRGSRSASRAPAASRAARSPAPPRGAPGPGPRAAPPRREKPVCLAVSGGKPVVVLPGFPASAIFTFHEFVAPVIRKLAGRDEQDVARVAARVPYAISSEIGRTEYVLVHLVEDDAGSLVAYPIGKGSGSITAWSQADGYFVIPRAVEQLDAREAVSVLGTARARPRPHGL